MLQVGILYGPRGHEGLAVHRVDGPARVAAVPPAGHAAGLQLPHLSPRHAAQCMTYLIIWVKTLSVLAQWTGCWVTVPAEASDPQKFASSSVYNASGCPNDEELMLNGSEHAPPIATYLMLPP